MIGHEAPADNDTLCPTVAHRLFVYLHGICRSFVCGHRDSGTGQRRGMGAVVCRDAGHAWLPAIGSLQLAVVSTMHTLVALAHYNGHWCTVCAVFAAALAVVVANIRECRS